MISLALFSIGLVLGILYFVIFKKPLIEQLLEREKTLNSQIAQKDIEIKNFEALHNQALFTIRELETERNKLALISTRLETELGASKNHSLFLEKVQKESIENSKTFFKSIAQEILEEKSIKISDHNKQNLSEILNPLKEKLNNFEQIIWRTNKEDAERVTSLKKEITMLNELSNKVNIEAHNLTKAIKGDSKQQGIWGEFILESILEKSGLVQNREYFIQQSHSVENGKIQRPDVIVKLPNDRNIIIDSKISLKNYEQFFSAENDIVKREEIKKHLLSIRNHIKELSQKEYHKLYNFDGIDFVFLFVPIEAIFSTTIQNDPEIFDFAYDKNIVLVSPSTLLATLRTVNNVWQNETRNLYSMEIAKQAGEMYDKLVNFVEDLKKIGQRIEQSQSQYNDAMSKLSTGKGNLVTRAENMKKLGAKASKQLDRNLCTD